MKRIWAVVLAAGQSSRLGRPKQLLELGGVPVLEHVLRAAAQSSLDGIVLVVGHDAERIRSAVTDYGQRVVYNQRYRDGQSTSLAAGLQALPSDVNGALVLLSDQPQLSSELIDSLLAAACETDRDDIFVQPEYGGRPGNPILIGRAWFGDLGAHVGDSGARELIREHPDHVVRIAVNRETPLLDIDTETDYEIIRAAWNAEFKKDAVN